MDSIFLAMPRGSKIKGEMFGRKSLGFGYVHKFLKNKLIVLPERKYYLKPLLNHSSNLIINGPNSHCAGYVDRRVEFTQKESMFYSFPGGLVGWLTQYCRGLQL